MDIVREELNSLAEHVKKIKGMAKEDIKPDLEELERKIEEIKNRIGGQGGGMGEEMGGM